ncbi:recombinase family protein [Pseudomonas sp. 9Ag]|uniref:recombinase family protein n=1 Tax=Pseudomonas sp. 9Ag TaxID=2653167 RepID=UPI0012F39BC9|nr:recombinase family protein [Pseudomonas sp. 9Ag]VXC99205.1 Resolvase [Pseudomonas sp. 9Ag]
MHNARIYLRASTKEQDCRRAESKLVRLAEELGLNIVGVYAENASGTKLDRPHLVRLLNDAHQGDVLLCESVDRLSRLSTEEWKQLRTTIEQRDIKLVVADLPTTHMLASTTDITSQVMSVVNSMLLDLMATMSRLDQDKRVERIKEGIERRKARGEAIPKRGKNQAIWQAVETAQRKFPRASAAEIARLAGCGVATVYRVRSALSENQDQKTLATSL